MPKAPAKTAAKTPAKAPVKTTAKTVAKSTAKKVAKSAPARPARDTDDLSPAARKVSQDVTRGLSRYFAPTGGFAIAAGFHEAAPITNGTHTAVVWEYSGVHTRAFQGIQPTQRPVVIRGVTVLYHPPRDTALFHRYVDWSDVMAQLGLDTTGRPALDALPGRD